MNKREITTYRQIADFYSIKLVNRPRKAAGSFMYIIRQVYPLRSFYFRRYVWGRLGQIHTELAERNKLQKRL